MEVFICLKAEPLLVRSSPLRMYRNAHGTDEARIATISDIEALHNALENVYKEVSKRNRMNRTRAQKWQNAKTNVLPLNITVGDYVMIRTHAKREHKLQFRWRGPMLVKDAKSSLVFIVQDLVNA